MAKVPRADPGRGLSGTTLNGMRSLMMKARPPPFPCPRKETSSRGRSHVSMTSNTWGPRLSSRDQTSVLFPLNDKVIDGVMGGEGGEPFP